MPDRPDAVTAPDVQAAKDVELLRQAARVSPVLRDAVERVAARVEQLETAPECMVCGHAWRRHDPEDGMCDAHSDEPGIFGPCQCGRDLPWMQTKIAALSRAALSAAGGQEQT